MAHWLFKEEPNPYGFADLERDGSTLWNGVTNNLARQNLRKVRRGDRIFFYHTGKEKAVVGEMSAVSGSVPDPDSNDAAGVAVQVKAERRLLRPVSLAQVKDDPAFAGWDLVRLPRLSVMPVNELQWRRIMELGNAQITDSKRCARAPR